jgi:hypothetical protein
MEKMRIKFIALYSSFACFVPMTAIAQVAMSIDWSVCKQPDLSSATHVAAVKKLTDKYIAAAKSNSSVHIAVGLNKIYGTAVQERRDHVRLNYIAVGSRRPESQCALSEQNYAKLIAYRDASYYVMCRAEVGIGADDAQRKKKDFKSLAFAAIYDLLKSIGADFRAKPDEPMTPPGGFGACKRGAEDAFKDPLPTPADIAAFSTRLSLPDSEKQKLGDPEAQ